MQDVKYDIFLSSNSVDRYNPLIKKLIYELQSAGFLMWRNDLFLTPGQNWTEQISKAISKSRFFLFILSKNTSKLAITELRLALTQQFRKQNYFIIPVKIDNTPIPNQLKNLFFADLKDYRNAVDQILQRILKEDQKTDFVNFEIDKIQNDHSSIIQISDTVNEKLIKYFYNNPNELKRIDRRLFEELIAELFHGFGYEVELTKRTRDGGKDVIAINKKIVNVKYLIECKRPDPENKVSIQVVKNLYATKVDEQATKGILATTAFFTKDAKMFFDRHKWELEPCDYYGIMDWLKDYLEIKK